MYWRSSKDALILRLQEAPTMISSTPDHFGLDQTLNLRGSLGTHTWSKWRDKQTTGRYRGNAGTLSTLWELVRSLRWSAWRARSREVSGDSEAEISVKHPLPAVTCQSCCSSSQPALPVSLVSPVHHQQQVPLTYPAQPEEFYDRFPVLLPGVESAMTAHWHSAMR